MAWEANMAGGTLLSIGHGYTAAALARRLLPQGWRVIGTTRNPHRAESMRAIGIEPVSWPLADPQGTLRTATHLLCSVAPVEGADPVLAAISGVLMGAAPALRWIGYLSTTGVYGDHAGGWVDEETQPKPTTDRARARLAAEARWFALGRASDVPVQVFRLGGIYGPGRGPFEALRAGTTRSIIKPGQVFSRIHVDDIAAVLEASMAQPNPGRLYNVVDDEPAPPQDVQALAAGLLGLAPPPAVPFEEEAPRMNPMAREFYGESRRVRNQRIREELGVALAYPTYREGLAAVLAAEAAADGA
jgi:nucleoside-diphosphate-sugar epimerase